MKKTLTIIMLICMIITIFYYPSYVVSNKKIRRVKELSASQSDLNSYLKLLDKPNAIFDHERDLPSFVTKALLAHQNDLVRVKMNEKLYFFSEQNLCNFSVFILVDEDTERVIFTNTSKNDVMPLVLGSLLFICGFCWLFVKFSGEQRWV